MLFREYRNGERRRSQRLSAFQYLIKLVNGRQHYTGWCTELFIFVFYLLVEMQQKQK